MPWPLNPQEKDPQYPLDRRLGGPQSLYGCGCKKNKSLLLPGMDSQSSSL